VCGWERYEDPKSRQDSGCNRHNLRGQKFKTTNGQLISVQEKRLKPDPVAIHGRKDLTVDNTVRFERGCDIARVVAEKTAN
jgi:hypothetical protein